MSDAQPVPPFEPIDAEGLRKLLHGPWSLVRPEDTLLGSLQGASLDGYRLLALVGSKNNVGSAQVYLVDSKGTVGRDDGFWLAADNINVPYSGVNSKV